MTIFSCVIIVNCRLWFEERAGLLFPLTIYSCLVWHGVWIGCENYNPNLNFLMSFYEDMFHLMLLDLAFCHHCYVSPNIIFLTLHTVDLVSELFKQWCWLNIIGCFYAVIVIVSLISWTISNAWIKADISNRSNLYLNLILKLTITINANRGTPTLENHFIICNQMFYHWAITPFYSMVQMLSVHFVTCETLGEVTCPVAQFLHL